MTWIAWMDEHLVVFFVPRVHKVPTKHRQPGQGIQVGWGLGDGPGGILGSFASRLHRPELDLAQTRL